MIAANQNVNQNIKTILLAEDDLDDQMFITDALYGIDHQLAIHTVSNGKEVLGYLDACPDEQLPQLLILDYNLPLLDGAEVLQALMQQQRYQHIAKIVWSTSNAPQYKLRSRQLGAALYMVKPSHIAGIETMAHQMLHLNPVSA